MRLANSVVLVTGAARGIGKAAAERFVAEGARVAIADVDEDRGRKTAADLGCRFYLCDVSKPADVNATVLSVIEDFGQINVLVNNAGYYPLQKFEDISVDDWDRVIDTNLKSVFLMTKAVHPHMKAAGGGKVINLCSAAVWMGSPKLVHYTAAKGGVLGITRSLAHALGGDNIQVNAVAPGLILTETVAGDRPRSELDARAELQALKRHAYAEDITGSLVFLASRDSDFMTGQTMVVDGGRVLH